MKKRLISILLSVAMLFSLIPQTILAVGEDNNPFGDISKSDWFYNAAMYVYERGIFKGTDETSFSPNGTMTRGMFVTVLGRIASVDSGRYSASNSFSDVLSEFYYAPYITWAVETGITTGVGDGKFDPDALVSREQMAAFQLRFFTATGVALPEKTVEGQPADLEQIAPYAREAVLTLWGCGLLKGDEQGRVNPVANATRAEAASLCTRLDTWVKDGKLPDEGATTTPTPTPSTTPTTPSGNNGDRDSGSSSSSRDPIQYQISFQTNGGSPLPTTMHKVGTQLDNLPIPYKQGVLFEGWYYDAALTRNVLSSDLLQESLTLYAKYGELPPLEQSATPQSATALDQETNFSVRVQIRTESESVQTESRMPKLSQEPMDATSVAAAITAKNLNSVKQAETPLITVTDEGDGFYRIGPVGGAFEAGATYKLMLNDDRLCFEGCATSVREYSFTTKKEEVQNLSLQSDLHYIPATEVTEMTKDGEKKSSLDVPVMRVGTDVSAVDVSQGSFVYQGEDKLNVGETVVIYEGKNPDERGLDDEGATAYVRITKVDGDTYSYETAEAEDVIFTPDILPLPNNADEDQNPDNNSITLAKTKMDYSADVYANIGLDSQTKVDAGDYIVFYSGDFGSSTQDGMQISSYVCIETVIEQEGDLVITYKPVQEAEMRAAMDVYNTEKVDSKELITEAEKADLEKQIEKQARESGFAEEAAQYLADAALETNSFTELSEEMRVAGISMRKEDGTPLTVAEQDQVKSDAKSDGKKGSKKVSVEIKDMHCNIDRTLRHFETNDGLRVVLSMEIEITIQASEDNQIIITVSGAIEQEAYLNLNLSGGAVWDVWGIFPYIREYEATASIDVYDYTGIEINASLVTRERKAGQWVFSGDFKDIGKELKALVEGTTTNGGDGKGTVLDNIGQKYQKMLETESDWVSLFEQEIFSSSTALDGIGILVLDISMDFVVAANMNILLGCDFYYEDGKRYVYTIAVFEKSVTNEVINLVEESYEFTFYVMGTLGLRAGIRLEAKLGVFTTKLAGIGFSAEAGVYLQVWGYFYYNLKYTESKGRSSRYGGALYFELGMYLEIKFIAEAINGKYTYDPMLYENAWPLWHAGTQRNIQDFSYQPEETPEVKLKRFVQAIRIPDTTFEMRYLDLKKGDMGKVICAEDKFTIKMTNPAFSYNAAENLIEVKPGGNPEEDGKMIVSWKNEPLAFTSAPIQREIKLHWDNLNDGYYIAFHSNGGSPVDIILKKHNEEVTPPANPTRVGYIFDGWYKDEAFQTPYTFPEKMPNTDVLVYAKWKPAPDTVYTVEHYRQNLKNIEYELVESQSLTGTTDSTVTPTPITWAGFTVPEAQELVIRPDGSAVVRYFSSRQFFTLTFDPGMGMERIVKKVRYGANITAPVMRAEGYDFVGWNDTVATTMPSSDVTYTASWTPSATVPTPYRVEYYFQNTTGDGVTLYTVQKHEGKTEDEISAQNHLLADEYHVGLHYSYATVAGEKTESTTISGDGKTVLKLYYERNVHTLNVACNEADSTLPEAVEYRFDALIAEPNSIPIKEGYKFVGWYTDVALTTQADFTKLHMPDADMTLYARLELDLEAGYPITYNGLYGATNAGNPIRFEVGSPDISLVAPGERTGYTFAGWFTDGTFNNAVGNVAIPTHSIGQKVFYAKWDKVSYAITYHNVDGAKHTNPVSYTIESDAIALTAAAKSGYTFEGWFTDSKLENAVTLAAIPTGSDGTRDFYAKWTPNSYQVVFLINAVTGQSGTMEPQSFTYDVEQKLDKAAFTRKGYTFAGWNTTPNTSNALYTDEQSVKNLATAGITTLYAVWKPISYSITYELSGGTNSNKNQTNYTIETVGGVTLLDPSKTGYTFQGWYENGSYSGSPVYIIKAGDTGDKTLYAKWRANTYTIHFSLPGGASGDNISGTMSSLSCTYDQGTSLTQNAYKRPGYTFAGWNTSSSASTVLYKDKANVSNLIPSDGGSITLYPVWTPITYSLRYTTGGVTNPSGNFWGTTVSKQFNEKFTLPGDPALMNGWYYNASGGMYKIGTEMGGLSDKDGTIIELRPAWKTGKGTAEEPFLIYDRGTLENMKNHLSSQFKLIGDVNLSGTNWTPIGPLETPFTGVLDGNGHTISNMNVRVVSVGNNPAQAGLFDTIMGATIKNLKFTSSTVETVGYGQSAMIAAFEKHQESGKGTLCDGITISADCKITSDAQDGSSAGLIALVKYDTTIKNCSVSGTFVGNTKAYLVAGVMAGAKIDCGTGNTSTTGLPAWIQ